MNKAPFIQAKTYDHDDIEMELDEGFYKSVLYQTLGVVCCLLLLVVGTWILAR
jgi:hypothetical protein